ncbi:undecaprenyl-phosphate glucose phosphotransferase [Vibrio sp. RE86]|uniref:undecaprenyl-phosphate glucose phosphotransferase n=1 Tax=Vibrio sp. RE86 TaxID=2607605 RepID=UPI001493714B|nr:undecaprenyl-phosphate glucose phosphotransferase [Vibrio sp. RE86]NOH79904.1 undecaprenyl-phosphate glucose phosphotransferase [Vibrio sp. RE86]
MKSYNNIRLGEQESITLYRIVDCVIIFSVLLLVSLLYLGHFTHTYYFAGTFAALLFVFFGENNGLYKGTSSYSTSEHLSRIGASWIKSILCILLLAFFSKWSHVHSRVVITMWMVAVPLALLGVRVLSRNLVKLHYKKYSYKQKAIIVGQTSAGVKLALDIQQTQSNIQKIIGFYDDRTAARNVDVDQLRATGLKLEGTIAQALELAKTRKVKHVYIAISTWQSERVQNIVRQFSDTTAHVYLVPDINTFEPMQARWRSIGGSPTISIQDTPFYGFSSIVKRVQDIVLSSIIITLISPVLVLVAFGVRLSSPGPIIFKQNRYGLDGKEIKVWKFRSMSVMDNGAVVKQATKNDARVTKFGRFIRKTSLDELPQFINVLQGRMSIVGPRPHAVAHNEEYRQIVDKYMLRHKVKPGITGLAQISGYRGEIDTLEKMEKRIEYDLKYIQHWSLFLDIKIVFLTIFKGFVSKTAY